MAVSLKNLTHAAERQVFSAGIDHFLKHLGKMEDRTEAYLKLVDAAAHFYGKAAPPETLDKVRAAIRDPENRWFKFINSVIDDTDPHVAKMFLLNLGYEAFFRGTKMIRENREKYDCNIPWLILFDPTNACNMHCEGPGEGAGRPSLHDDRRRTAGAEERYSPPCGKAL